MPDRRAGEAGDDLDAELRRGARGVLHPLRGALPHALGIAVAPDLRVGRTPLWRSSIGSHTAWPTRWLPIAQHAEAVALEQLAPAGGVAGVAHRLGDVEVVAPAGQLEPVEAPARRLRGEVVERQVGPLAGEQRDGSAHAPLLGVGDLQPHAGGRYSSATSAGSSASVTIASSSCARAIDSSDARPNFVASISADGAAPRSARAALITSASGRRVVVSPCRGDPGGGDERDGEVELGEELDRPAPGEHPHVLVELARGRRRRGSARPAARRRSPASS